MTLLNSKHPNKDTIVSNLNL